MPKLTVLEMVQDILNDIEGDEVNSISDTQEATQIAQIIKTTYYAIIDGKEFAHLQNLFQLDASGTVSKPTHMPIPEEVVNVDWVKYNTRSSTDTKDKYTKMVYKTPSDFLDIVEARDSSATEIDVITDDSGAKLNIYNDRAPTYYTSFDDENIVMDAYDSAVDATLLNNKSQCYGKSVPTFTISDSFIPDLPTQMFSYLLADAKSTCFIVLKQAPNPKAEQISTSQRRRMSQEAWKVKKGITYPNYGRK